MTTIIALSWLLLSTLFCQSRQCRSKIRLHILCCLILIHTGHNGNYSCDRLLRVNNPYCTLKILSFGKKFQTGLAPPGWLSDEHVGLITWWLWVRSPVKANFLSGVLLPLTSVEACEKSSRWLWKEKLCYYWCEKVTDRHDMTLDVKVALNPNTTNYRSDRTFLFLYLSRLSINPLPHMPILGSSDSAANKDMMSKIWTNGDTIIWLRRKHCGKRRNCSSRAISSFPTKFTKAVCCWSIKMSIYGVKGSSHLLSSNTDAQKRA